METKIVPEYVYEGLGFPVLLSNVPMVKVQGVWAPKVHYANLQKQVLFELVRSSTPLTGSEVVFIRHYFHMTLEEFGKILGVRHSAVIKWEAQGDNITKATPTTELCIRLLILEKLEANDDVFRFIFRDFDMEKMAEMQRHPPDAHIISLNALSSCDEQACG